MRSWHSESSGDVWRHTTLSWNEDNLGRRGLGWPRRDRNFSYTRLEAAFPAFVWMSSSSVRDSLMSSESQQIYHLDDDANCSDVKSSLMHCTCTWHRLMGFELMIDGD